VSRRRCGVVALSSLLAAGFGAACSQASLPPGTPPPEYEVRPVAPWPPESAAPAAPTGEPPAAEPAAPPPAADLPNDAGVPELPDAAVDAAPETGPF
jgi:hypothetical protein